MMFTQPRKSRQLATIFLPKHVQLQPSEAHSHGNGSMFHKNQTAAQRNFQKTAERHREPKTAECRRPTQPRILARSQDMPKRGVQSTVCQSAVCQSVVCQSVVCQGAYVVLGRVWSSRCNCAAARTWRRGVAAADERTGKKQRATAMVGSVALQYLSLTRTKPPIATQWQPQLAWRPRCGTIVRGCPLGYAVV